MAIAFYTGQDEKYCLVDQGTWGVAPSTAAAGQGIHIAEWDLKPMVNFLNPNRAKAQRYNYTSDMMANEKGVIHEISMPATPFLKDQGDKFIYGVMQSVSEGTATPFVKTFTFPLTQPDFSANAGHFETLVNKMPVASTSHYVNDAVISQLTLACAPGANDGMLTAEATWNGRGHVENFNYNGTITYPDVNTADFFYFWDLTTKTINATEVTLGDEGFKMVITNGLQKLGGTSGKPETYRLTFYSCVTTVTALWDTTLRTAMAAQRAGTAVSLVFEWGTPGADGHLSFTIYGKWRESRDLSHARDGSFVTLTHDGSGTYGTTEPLKVLMANAIDRTW